MAEIRETAAQGRFLGIHKGRTAELGREELRYGRKNVHACGRGCIGA